MTATLDPDWAPVQCLERQPWGQRWLVQHLGDGRVRECIRIGMAGYDEARLREQLQAYERAADANPALARVERVETWGGEVHLWVEYRAASSLAPLGAVRPTDRMTRSKVSYCSRPWVSA